MIREPAGIILLNSSSSDDGFDDAMPVNQNVIELLSSDKDDERPENSWSVRDASLELPLRERVNRLLQKQVAPESKAYSEPIVMEFAEDSRDSLPSYQELMYQKWVQRDPKPFQTRVEPLAPLKPVETTRSVDPKPVAIPPKTEEPIVRHVQPPRVDPLNTSDARQPKTKDEACKEVTMLVDTRLNGFLGFAEQMDVPFAIQIENLDDEAMVMWQRRPWDRPGQVVNSSVCALVLQVEQHGEAVERDPEAFVEALKGRVRDAWRYSQIYLMLVGFKAYAAKVASRTNRSFRAAVLAGDRLSAQTRDALIGIQASWAEIEHRLWLACADICGGSTQSPFRMCFAETAAMTRQVLQEITRDVAWLPHNFTCAARFNAAAASSSGVKRLDDSPAESLRLMLAAIPRVTPQMAQAIIRIHTSYAALLRAFQTIGPTLLQGIIVGQGSGRNIGPAISAKIHAVVTGRDPDKLVK